MPGSDAGGPADGSFLRGNVYRRAARQVRCWIVILASMLEIKQHWHSRFKNDEAHRFSIAF
jgi:hypothetical protein